MIQAALLSLSPDFSKLLDTNSGGKAIFSGFQGENRLGFV
jgi:hypothetical protein